MSNGACIAAASDYQNPQTYWPHLQCEGTSASYVRQVKASVRAWISRLTRSISFLMLCRRCISSFLALPLLGQLRLLRLQTLQRLVQRLQPRLGRSVVRLRVTLNTLESPSLRAAIAPTLS